MRSQTLALCLVVSILAAATSAADPTKPEADVAALRVRILSVAQEHLDALIDADGRPVSLKGKSAEGLTAFAFQRVYESTGNRRYAVAALAIADTIVAEMKQTKHGVLYIKEKAKGGEMIAGGGPPALGIYVAAAAYVFQRQGNREADLKFLAKVIDDYPWNDEGWWASTIDVNTGEPKVPITKSPIINKTASVAMAAGMLGEYVLKTDPKLARRLTEKAHACVDGKIVPAQEPDGYWHYNLSGNDPGNNDILGYFMVTCDALIVLRQCTDSFCEPPLQKALEKASEFAMSQIAPMTDPNRGPPSRAERRTPSTPIHFTPKVDGKRGFSLAAILLDGGQFDEGAKIADHWLNDFPVGDVGQDGAHAIHSVAVMLNALDRR